jgi:hypothetical protein
VISDKKNDPKLPLFMDERRRKVGENKKITAG